MVEFKIFYILDSNMKVALLPKNPIFPCAVYEYTSK